METHLQVGKIRDYIKGNQKGHIKMYKHPNFWLKNTLMYCCQTAQQQL